MRPINCGFRSLKGKASIVNAVNKLYSVWIYENHICVLPSEELYEWRSSQLNTQFLQLRKESLKKTQSCTGFEPLTSAITVQRSTNSANKPTGSRSLNWFLISPWKDDDEVMNIWKSVYVNCGVKNYMNEDLRSYIRNFCSCEKGSLKKLSLSSRLQSSTDLFCTGKKIMNWENKSTWNMLAASHYSYWNVFYLVEMRNLSRNSSARELNWKKLVDKIITYYFTEWNNMIWIEYNSAVWQFSWKLINVRLSSLTLHEA